MEVPNVRGLVVGRALLYPPDGDVAGAIERAAAHRPPRTQSSNVRQEMTMKLTTAQAIVKYLIAQRTTIDGVEAPLFPGVFAIFGHGNVTCLGQALEEARDELPTWRGQNEQGMALAAVGYAKAMRRRQIMVATSSIGPGATNMVTAAGVAHSNRLPLLLLVGRHVPEPDPRSGAAAGRALPRPDDDGQRRVQAGHAATGTGSRSPEQLVHSLPHAVATMLDPATCGPAFLALPQDVQAEAFEYPDHFFDVDGPRGAASATPTVRQVEPRRRRDPRRRAAVDHLRWRRALLGCRVRAAGVRRALQHPRRRDGRRQGVAARRPIR